jgi:hypothetical protein
LQQPTFTFDRMLTHPLASLLIQIILPCMHKRTAGGQVQPRLAIMTSDGNTKGSWVNAELSDIAGPFLCAGMLVLFKQH